MNWPKVSVCVVSWHRPDALRRCLVGLGQMDYPSFEIVVVADQQGLQEIPRGAPIKLAQAAEPNVSIARNIGIGLSAGDVVAFIDDDAVPEPSWLRALVLPFADEAFAAAGGFVRGRNGISWQWRGRVVNRLGETRPYVPGDPVPDGFAVKTEGTNMAVRRCVLKKIGGFDPAFAFFLDETDLNIRLHEAGYRTALVPSAIVHHGYMASRYRRADRVPQDLRQIGASWAVFLNKHASPEQRRTRMDVVCSQEDSRLMRHLIRGGLEPRDVQRIRRSLHVGFDEGCKRVFGAKSAFPDPPAFALFPAQQRVHLTLACAPLTFRSVYHDAVRHVRAGKNATLFCLSHTPLYHSVKFSVDGVWVHRGGVFGKSERNQPVWSFQRKQTRIDAEIKRVARERNIAMKTENL